MKKDIIFLLAVLFLKSAESQNARLNFPIGVQGYTFRNHFPTNVIGTLDHETFWYHGIRRQRT
jgi:hypothetical protein